MLAQLEAELLTAVPTTEEQMAALTAEELTVALEAEIQAAMLAAVPMAEL